jgi:hypothetical protein
VAAEYRDVPTWEEAIGCLSLRTPSEDHARRTENRYRRSNGGGGGREGGGREGGGGRGRDGDRRRR